MGFPKSLAGVSTGGMGDVDWCTDLNVVAKMEALSAQMTPIQLSLMVAVDSVDKKCDDMVIYE